MNSDRVLLWISDPWDLGESVKWQPIPGELVKTISDETGGRALIRLEKPMEYQGLTWRFIVASPRHENATIAAVRERSRIASAFTGISEPQAEGVNWCDTSKGRGGGLAFIGAIELDETERA